ncbi:glutamate-5-semialdehyde dehydrogenase [Maribacter hydrothermalis]|uniref:Gamma-glutamyl phosphate reductase n=1 Tax=Maribacter hydrothermalis TaxID=1836467 RepID=A0A1B7YXM9_9FLAO|nr:glutamate-5-semialdehyde dehydrogenase [Maribacter hydrothermalis]APQ16817.1 glutamate-5-semialdehyde dehydrogenase [Maribacter hydrothermalis]OBR35245.1 glutamate-5-semialdehyde dehydrogenase [Maribacter hydrothermalis]
MKIISTEVKNKVLNSMMRLLDDNRSNILDANKKDLDLFKKDDQAMYDRLIVTNSKIDGMIGSIKEVMSQDDPVGKIISTQNLENGLDITNKTAPFGTIMIIYESRPDVTIEAAVLAFKANNKILLKGGKEALYSNTILVELWHKALEENGLPKEYIQQLTKNREETQEFLRNPTEKLDLIVPRGGERLINFVKEHAKCAVLVSGRGNNFLFVDKEADWEKSVKVIMNAKTEKISACNALDKILINANIENYEKKLTDIYQLLSAKGVETLVDADVNSVLTNAQQIKDDAIWKEEFLAMKCCLGSVDSLDEAVEKINDNSGGHSATIMTSNKDTAMQFMEEVDCAAVYQNASTRFTDGGQMGVGAELAISTDKLHHRGPLGLKQLVTNKYYIFGDGQIRE